MGSAGRRNLQPKSFRIKEMGVTEPMPGGQRVVGSNPAVPTI